MWWTAPMWTVRPCSEWNLLVQIEHRNVLLMVCVLCRCWQRFELFLYLRSHSGHLNGNVSLLWLSSVSCRLRPPFVWNVRPHDFLMHWRRCWFHTVISNPNLYVLSNSRENHHWTRGVCSCRDDSPPTDVQIHIAGCTRASLPYTAFLAEIVESMVPDACDHSGVWVCYWSHGFAMFQGVGDFQDPESQMQTCKMSAWVWTIYPEHDTQLIVYMTLSVHCVATPIQ